MVKGFSTKKIKSEKSLGEILKSIRIKKNISIESAEVGTKVRAKYLNSLEKGDWADLPQDVYLRGFVLAYAKFLGFDTDKAVELYENETTSLVFGKKHKNKISYNHSLSGQKVLITPKILAYFSLSVFVLSMFSYVVFQVLKFAGNPSLEIVSPQNNIIIETDSTELSGITDVDTMIAVNNENVPVTNDGRFQLELKLNRGINVIKVQAINKAKKETAQVFTVEYKPKTASLLNNNTQ